MLYGTTYHGGSYGNSGGEGTVFRMGHAGTDERIVYNFGGSVGAQPSSSVLAVNGKLYGTTNPGFSNGTAYDMTLVGKNARLLHQFTASPDGFDPNALTYFNRVLYGTTQNGGKYGGSHGDGTIFKLTLPSH